MPEASHNAEQCQPSIKQRTPNSTPCYLARPTARNDWRDAYGATNAYTTVDALLADEALDAIYVSTPVHLHYEQVVAAAERGLHVLCDKPMALTPQECREMIAACDANSVHLQVCFLFRFHSCFSTDPSVGERRTVRADCPRTHAVFEAVPTHARRMARQA